MTCVNISSALILIVCIAFILCLAVGMFMYLDGYWSIEQRKSRWNRDHFAQWK